MHEMANGRPHPHLAIPPGAAPPSNPSPVTDQWNFLVTPPPDSSSRDPLGLWSETYRNSSFALASPDSTYPSSAPSYPVPSPLGSDRSRSRPSSLYEPPFAFPEPQLHRSISQRSSLRPSASRTSLGHRSTRSEIQLPTAVHRGESRPPSFIASDGSSPESLTTVLTDELSNLTLASEEGLRKFQAGELAENDEEWYRLAPPEASSVLDNDEVQRQSVIFEIIKSERDYVRDLELVKDLFIEPLLNTSFVPPPRVKGFVAEVFYNIEDILVHHRRLLDGLFQRQLEQHPLIQSIADLVLDTSITFRPPYEEYIKHYPLSEAHHRNELRKNRNYQYFLSQCSQDPRTRKRDLITFISRPVTRLPRLALLVDTMKKRTAPDHPDQETLPLLLSLLNEFIKSTQPGIEAAESRVKFWGLCESLVYQKGEIIDLDLYDETRTVIRLGSLARRYRKDNTVGYAWADLNVALLDNYLLLLKPERRPGGAETRNIVVSRPIPLEYLQVTSFDLPPETRKEKSSSVDHAASSRSLLDSFSIRSKPRPMYPFTISHAADQDKRKYTLYASSVAEREKWRVSIKEAIALRKARQEANMWFAPHTINEGFFKAAPEGVPSYGMNGVRHFTGRITCATPLSSGGKSLIAVGCDTGVYVLVRGQSNFRKVLQLHNVQAVATIPTHNKIIIDCESGLKAYSLDILARVAMQTSTPQSLDNSMENLTAPDDLVYFMKVAKFEGRSILLYARRGLLKVYLHLLTPVLPDELPPHKKGVNGPISFRPFIKEPIALPGDSHDVTALKGKIGVCADKGIHIFDLQHFAAVETIIPNLAYSGDHPPMRLLQERLAKSKPLGLVKCGNDELLVVFNDVGCYINSRGEPARQCGYLRWETSASWYTCRKDHLILFSPQFIEVRTLQTGKLVQVIEGQEIRMVHASEETVLVAMKKPGSGSSSEDILIELVPTQEIEVPQPLQSPNLWDEWDM